MGKILIVDDEPLILKMMRSLVEELGYIPICAESGERALNILEYESPDIILMDIEMPGMDGITTVKKIREKGIDSAIIMLTISKDEESIRKSAEAGADDYLIKSSDLTEVSVRLKLAEKAKSFYKYKKALFDRFKTFLAPSDEIIQRLTEDNISLSLELIEKLNIVVEYRSAETSEHTIRVGDIVEILLLPLRKSHDYTYALKIASTLHDIGKIGIPDSILLKPSKLTPQEFETVKKHTVIGERILRGSQSFILKIASIVALNHHERWDGLGYPRGLKGEEIPLEGRVVCVADAIETMFSGRVYKSPMKEKDVKEELIRCKGTQFDPMIVDIALENWDKILELFKGENLDFRKL